MLESGVTSKREQCLVAEGGFSGNNGTHLVLQSCQDAVRAGDGRELFYLQADGQLVTVAGHKCVVHAEEPTFEEKDAGSQGSLVLDDCDANHQWPQSEKLVTWRATKDNTLRALRHGKDWNKCLSLDGHGQAGLQDQAPGGIPHATSSADDVAHGADRATDGGDFTYWVSDFNPDKPVTLQLDLRRRQLVSAIDIKWECKPKKYRVEYFDGRKWIEVKVPPNADAKNAVLGLPPAPKPQPPVEQEGEERRIDPMLDNKAVTYSEMVEGHRDQAMSEDQLRRHWASIMQVDSLDVAAKLPKPQLQLPVTHIPLHGAEASGVRLTMATPAPVCPTAKGAGAEPLRAFGVRELAVQVPRRRPIVAPCGDAAGDGRDRWFFNHVKEWNPSKKMPDFQVQFL